MSVRRVLGARPLTPFERSVASLGRVVFRAVARTHVAGFEDLPKTGPLIVVANHMSLADPPLVGGWLLPAVGRPVSFLAKQGLFVGPIGTFLRSHGMIMVRAGGSDIDAYRHARAVLDAGGVICIFPEGTRSMTGTLIEAKQGVVLLASRSGAPVLPVGVSGTDRFLAPGRKLPSVGARLSLRAGTPFLVELPRRPSREQLSAATDALMGHIAALIEPRHRGRYLPIGTHGPDTGSAAEA